MFQNIYQMSQDIYQIFLKRIFVLIFRLLMLFSGIPHLAMLSNRRVAQSAGIGGLDPSIAKDLIDSEDPKHTLFCREIAFVAIYALFRDNIFILW